MNKHGPMPDPWTMLAVIGFQSERTPPKRTALTPIGTREPFPRTRAAQNGIHFTSAKKFMIWIRQRLFFALSWAHIDTRKAT